MRHIVYTIFAILALSLSGAAADATFSPATLTWASTPVGNRSGPKSSTLTNNQSVALSITGVTVTGDFEIHRNTCPSSLAAGNSCSISLRFVPTAVGSRTGALSVTHDGPDSPAQLPLFGTGSSTVAAVTLLPSSLSFASQEVGTSSPPQATVLKNNQTTSLTISAISTTGDYSRTHDCPSILPAGSSCSISVVFTPTAAGTRTGNATVNHDGPNGGNTTTLSGSGFSAGSGGSLTFTPDSLSWASTAIGSTAGSKSSTLTNTQSSAVTITSIGATGDFLITGHNCPSTLAANGSCTVSAAFKPTAEGPRTGSVNVAHNAAGSPAVLPLSGTGVQPPVSLVPASLTFATQAVGGTSAAQAATLTNQQSSSLSITSISNTGDFLNTHNCPSTLSAGASCTIQVQFKPTAAGTRTGWLTVRHSAPNSPQSIPLTGEATSSGGGGGSTISGIYVAVRPDTTCGAPNQSIQFEAQVKGTTNTGVTWYVDNVLGGNNSVGLISNSGAYTAPSSGGSHTIKATSVADTTKSGFASIFVSTSIYLNMYPENAVVQTGKQQQFSAQVCGSANGGVQWLVEGVAGGNATVGTITSGGLYTAPGSEGTFRVQAAAAADPTKRASAPTTVFARIVADFGNRADTRRPIPVGIVGAQYAESLSSTSLADYKSAGLKITRTFAKIPQVFATSSTPDWSKIDPIINHLRNSGIAPILQIAYTPTWLGSTAVSCQTSDSRLPTNMTTYGSLAAKVVAHMNASFPGFITDYEIWNEPDLTLCTNDRLGAYLQIYAATASAMKSQAAADGVSIRVGGPALANTSLLQTWITSLLSDSRTAPYVDFVSYHTYFGGLTAVQAGVQWDDNTNTKSLYWRTQDRFYGAAAIFRKVTGYVRSGSQPNAAQTPIYVDEYNTNSAFVLECCRNHPTYAPLWNALFVADILNTVYDDSQAILGKLVYYAASRPPYFCLLSCSNGQPYPQFYAYRLMAAETHLDLGSGGYMATAVSPPTTQGGLVVTAFWTPAKDSILIVNPTPQDYSSLEINVRNIGFLSPQATSFLLNSSNAQISAGSVSLTPATSGFSATVAVPPYSVVAIAIIE